MDKVRSSLEPKEPLDSPIALPSSLVEPVKILRKK